MKKIILNRGLKHVILIRHGDLANPKNIVYNRDAIMKKTDIVHLSRLGRHQIRILAKVLKKKFNLVKIYTSPETRTKETTQIISKQLLLTPEQITISDDLDDTYAPGAYLEKLSMTKWRQLGGNAYDEKRWYKYHHEKPQQIIERMEKIFWRVAKNLSGGQAAALISHGDPIAWLINYLFTKKFPLASRLRHLIYPKKAGAFVLVINLNNEILEYYQLVDPALISGSIY